MASISPSRNKGQSGLELVILTTFALLAFSVAYLVFVDKDVRTISEKTNNLARMTTEDVAFEIRVAVSEGTGYEKNFTIPDSFFGMAYEVNVTDYMVFINLNNRSFLSYTTAESVTGAVVPGKNTIKNWGGVIYANT